MTSFFLLIQYVNSVPGLRVKRGVKEEKSVLILTISLFLYQVDIPLHHSVRNQVKFKFVGAAALSAASQGVKKSLWPPWSTGGGRRWSVGGWGVHSL